MKKCASKLSYVVGQGRKYGARSKRIKMMIVAANKERSRLYLASKREDSRIRRIKTGSAIVVI
jgi:hypothetical protein